jgi:dipeptidase D
MVCEKDRETVHDFRTDPIRLVRDQDRIHADGTTLGADNGIGVAAMLALMEDRTLVHPDLEFIFTVEEETGLKGATALSRESFSARTLINLDSEEEGTFYIGCAGGKDTEITTGLSYEEAPEKTEEIMLKITGLRGGHSGGNIHEGLGNAIKLLSRFLISTMHVYGFGLCDISGGSKHNAIPREAEAVIRITKENLRSLRKDATVWTGIFRNELEGIDDNVSLTLQKALHPSSRVMTRPDAEKVLNILQALPHGAVRTDQRLDTVVTSTNLAICGCRNNTFNITTSQRSLMQSSLDDIATQVRAVAELAGCRAVQGNCYPAWKPSMSSHILNACAEVYRRVFGTDPLIRVIHAGLECAVIGQKIKGMDMISLGPTIEHPHSPHERVFIPSVERFWRYLVRLLEYLAR